MKANAYQALLQLPRLFQKIVTGHRNRAEVGYQVLHGGRHKMGGNHRQAE
jgi:hypothetical protein